jgi:hypothetical protein
VLAVRESTLLIPRRCDADDDDEPFNKLNPEKSKYTSLCNGERERESGSLIKREAYVVGL